MRDQSARLNNMMSERSLLMVMQEKARRDIKSFDMSKLTARDPDSIRQGMPAPPLDVRFEKINSNFESVTKHKNT